MKLSRTCWRYYTSSITFVFIFLCPIDLPEDFIWKILLLIVCMFCWRIFCTFCVSDGFFYYCELLLLFLETFMSWVIEPTLVVFLDYLATWVLFKMSFPNWSFFLKFSLLTWWFMVDFRRGFKAFEGIIRWAGIVFLLLILCFESLGFRVWVFSADFISL